MRVSLKIDLHSNHGQLIVSALRCSVNNTKGAPASEMQNIPQL